MFERMEDGSRRVLVLAQEEARLAGHNHIGTEHLLLGLLADGVAADALSEAGVRLDPSREKVSQMVAPSAGGAGQTTSPPFTTRAKKVLEISLRESLARGSSTISPGDLLLGILREDAGVAVQVLTDMGVDLTALRVDVLARLAAQPPRPGRATPTGTTPFAGVAQRAPAGIGRIVPGRPTDVCSWCGRDTWEVSHFVSDGSVLLCEVCISDAADAMRAASEDQHRVTLPPRVFGTVPDEGAPTAILRAVDAFMADEPDGGWGPFVEDAETGRAGVASGPADRGGQRSGGHRAADAVRVADDRVASPHRASRARPRGIPVRGTGTRARRIVEGDPGTGCHHARRGGHRAATTPVRCLQLKAGPPVADRDVTERRIRRTD